MLRIGTPKALLISQNRGIVSLCVESRQKEVLLQSPHAHNWITDRVHAAVNYGMVQKELTHSPLPGSFRCDARATVRRDPVCLQRGCLPRQSPALLRLQLRVDRPATWYRLRQLPVSSPFLGPCEHPSSCCHGTPRSGFTELNLSSSAEDPKASFAHVHSPAASSGFAHIIFRLYRLETSSDSLSLRFSLLLIYSLVLIISQNAISSCCWRSSRGETSAVTPTTLTLPRSHSQRSRPLWKSPQSRTKLTKSLLFSYDSIFITVWF